MGASFMKRGTFIILLACLGMACGESKTLSVTGVEPDNGDAHGGEQVHITGTGFTTQGFAVYFGKRKAGKCSRSSPTALTCEVPGGNAGEKVDVQVIFDDSREATIKNAYMYTRPSGMGFTEPGSPIPAPPPTPTPTPPTTP
jgi:hypothetical protein